MRRAAPSHLAFAALLALAVPAAARADDAAAFHTLTTRPLVEAAPLAIASTQTLQMQLHESLATALARGGLPPAEIAAAERTLAGAFAVGAPHPGLTLTLTTRNAGGSLRLTELQMATRAGERLGLSREADGLLHLRRVDAPALSAPLLTMGVVKGSLYGSLIAAGLDAEAASRIVGVIGRRLDLARDVAPGDRFRLVFDHSPAGSAAPASGNRGELLYADVATTAGLARVYRYQSAPGEATQWVDGDGDPRRAGLLRTPLEAIRVTSAFGLRLHPLLGFTRMHQGVDFGAPVGTPVFAAADGVVEEARWDGGYGRWLKIRHADDLETGYGHLSGWAPAVAPGASVRQGEVVAYVGASGLATGPHLHFEVFKDGRRIDPRRAPSLSRAAGDPADDPQFRARKASIDIAVASLSAQCAAPGLFAGAAAPRCIG